MLVAIGCLYVAGGAAIIYLIEEALLQPPQDSAASSGGLPSLASLDRLIYHATLLRPALPHHGHGGRRHPRRDVQGAGLADRPDGAAVGRAPGPCTRGAHRRPRARRLVGRAPSPGSPWPASSCCSSSASRRSRTSAASTPTGAERMHVVVAGISHKTASLELRERLALDEEAALRVSQALLDEGVACEAVALSTCNRTELYLYGRDSLAARQAALGTSGAPRRRRAGRARAEPLLLLRRRRHRPPLPRHLEPRLDGRRRGADRRPAQGRLPAGLRRRLHQPWSSTGCSGTRWRWASACAPRPPSASAP